MKNTLKSIVGLTGMFICGVAAMTNPLLIAPAIAIGLGATRMATQGIAGNYIHDSFFIVTKNKRINMGTKEEPNIMKVDYLNQEAIPSLSRLINARKSAKENGNTKEIFVLEALNAFQQLKPDIKYGTKSQAETLFLLSRMQKKGYVKNLEHKPAGEMKLGLERFLFGTEKSNKKHKMNNITFEMTDRAFTEDDIKDFLKLAGTTLDKLDYKIDKKGHYIFSGKHKEKEMFKDENNFTNTNQSIYKEETKIEETKKNEKSNFDELGVEIKQINKEKEESVYDELGVKISNQKANEQAYTNEQIEAARRMLESEQTNEFINESTSKRL